MKCCVLLLICVTISTMDSAPLQMQWPSQMSGPSRQDEVLQNQLIALQQMQVFNQWNYGLQRLMQNNHLPVVILLPETLLNLWPSLSALNLKKADQPNEPTNFKLKDHITDSDEFDSVIVEAGHEPDPKPEPVPKKAILLIPNNGFNRGIIGDLVSAIPFLPIEINVPDAISWIYNGISGIIGGIGQRWPFNRPTQPTVEPQNMKMFLSKLQSINQNHDSPMLLLPDIAQPYPVFY